MKTQKSAVADHFWSKEHAINVEPKLISEVIKYSQLDVCVGVHLYTQEGQFQFRHLRNC